jgi:two-component system, NtrC family, response regulator AtoC
MRILFVGNDDSTKEQLLYLTKTGQVKPECTVTCVATAEAGLELLAQRAFDILITDALLPGMSGLDLLTLFQQEQPGVITIVITEPDRIDLAVNAMKRGATDVFIKPLTAEIVQDIIQVTTECATSRALALRRNGDVAPNMVARSSKMRKVLDQATAIAPFNTTVLVTGESGTGKELIARLIHEHSSRCEHPFVALNCAAIPDQLLEDELFGHVKGAFTGAQSSREGRFEYAAGGTLLLDEIGDMSLPLQAKLLRVLQEREFEKLGSSRTIKADVRIIAATSADLQQKIKDGSFRLDLYYRLNVVHLQLPPLHERPEDIRPLAQQLLARFCDSVGLPLKQIDDDVWGVLTTYHWPGNVRQLQNVMERAAALTRTATTIHVWDLPEEIRASKTAPTTPAFSIDPVLLSQPSLPDEGVSLDAVVTNIERELLLRSLNQTGGNKMQAAKLLKMKRTTFVEKLKRLRIGEFGDAMTELTVTANGDGVFDRLVSLPAQ